MHLSYRYSPFSTSSSSPRQTPRFSRKRLPLKHTRSTRSNTSFIKRLIKLCFVLGLGCLLFGAGVVVYYSRQLPDPNRLLARAVPLSTKIYDRTGTVLLYDIHRNEQRTLVAIKNIPDSVKLATLVAEDRGFYRHQGFDLKGIARAIVVDVLRGKKAQGGSTITQQFIKNALLSPEKTVTRKIKELVLAYQIEQRFSKDEILQLYLNEIPYGSTAYGISAAARIYFDTDVSRLTLAQAAVLAALPRAPSYYSPWGDNRDKLFALQHTILNGMVEEGYITTEQAQQAKEESLHFAENRQSIKAPHFVFYVREQLIDRYGEKMVEEGGLRVITTLDYEKQQFAHDAIVAQSKKNEAMNASNAALLALDTKDGSILAMVGSKDYFDESIDGNVNVTLRHRQPGSSIKPIVYAAAFEKGYTPSTVVFDVKTNFDTSGQKPYEPENYNGKEYGPVTLRKALAGSLNIPAVKVLYLVGVSDAVAFARRLGYSSLTDPDRYGLALVLGGAEVTLLEHVAGFASFAREGERVEPYSILRVEDAQGAVLFEHHSQQRERAFDRTIAQKVNDILSDNSARTYIFGEKNYLILPDRPVAAKTGTSNDFRDAWTIGYTPSLSAGVWVGNNNNKEMKSGADGSKLAAPIWQSFMKRSLVDTPMESFIKPPEDKAGKSMLDGGIGDEQKILFDTISGTVATDQTPKDRIMEKTFRTIHTILYYVNRDDPRGPLPTNPEQDPQFLSWETAVRNWVVKNHMEESAPPSPLSPNLSSLTSSISILSPIPTETLTTRHLVSHVQVSSPRAIRSVRYYLDDTLIATATESPFNLDTNLDSISNGFHTLTARVFDDAGTNASASVTLNILLPIIAE